MTPLMNAKEVGDFLGVSPRQVTERYMLVPGFPKAIRLPTVSGGRGKPKWVSSDISAWVSKYKGK